MFTNTHSANETSSTGITIENLKVTIAQAKANSPSIKALTVTKELIYPGLGDELLEAIKASDHLEKVDLIAKVFTSHQQLRKFYLLLAIKPAISHIRFIITYTENVFHSQSSSRSTAQSTYDLGPLLQKYLPWIRERNIVQHTFDSNKFRRLDLEVIVLLQVLFEKVTFTSIIFSSSHTATEFLKFISKCQTKLTQLSFINTGLPSTATTSLETIFNQCQKTLSVVELTNNSSLSATMPTLIKTMQSIKKLSRLSIDSCDLDDTAMRPLSDLVNNHPTLQVLNISSDGYRRKYFGSLGLLLLARALQKNQRLHSLYINNHQVDDDGVSQFLRELGGNRAITTLELSQFSYVNHRSNNNTKTVMAPLNKLLRENKQLATDIFAEATQCHMRNTFHKLRQGASPFMLREDKTTLLHVVVQTGDEIFTARLVKEFGLAIHLTNNKGETPLSLALASGKEGLVTALTNPDKVLGQSTAAESAAAAVTNPIVVTHSNRKRNRLPPPDASQPSVAHLFNPRGDKRYRVYPIASAAASEHARPVAMAVFDDTTIGEQLCYFANQGEFTEIETLLEHQSQAVNYINAYGQTALHAAAQSGHADVIKLLLSHEAKATVADHAGLTALHFACLYAKLDVVTELVKVSDITAKCIHGYSVLFYTLGGLTYPTSDVDIDHIRAAILHSLIQAKLDITEVKNDLSMTRNNVTALHIAANRGLYKVFKTLLFQNAIDINAQDNQGETILHYLVKHDTPNHIAMLDRLLLEPTLDPTKVNVQGLHALALARNLFPAEHAIRQLLQQVRQLPSPDVSLHWAQKLTFTYGSRPDKANKQVIVDASDMHAGLRAIVAREMPSTDRSANLAAANLIFVISDKKHRQGGDHGRTSVKVNLTLLEQKQTVHISDFWQTRETVADSVDASESAAANVSNFSSRKTRSPDALQRVINRYEQASEYAKAHATDDIHDSSKPLTAKGTRSLYSTSVILEGTKSYELRYHHSETGLYDHLEKPETIRTIVEAFKQNANYSEGCKVYAVVLNIHSKFYICFDCELGLLGLQNPNSAFISQLREALLAQNCVFSANKPLATMSLFSTQRRNGYERTRTAAEHQPVHVDLRVGRNDVILQQDVNVVTSEGAVYISRRVS